MQLVKMRGFFLAFFFFSFSSVLFSQSNPIDSLTLKLSSATKDTSRIALWIKIGIEYRNVNLDSSDIFLSKALKLSEAKKYKILRLDALNEQAFNLVRKNDSETALQKLNSVYRAITHLKTAISGKADIKKLNQVLVYNLEYMGIALRKMGNLPEAIEKFTGGLKLAEQLKSFENQSAFLNNLAQTFYMQGKYPESLKYCLRGLKLNEKYKNKKGVASATGNAGILFKEMGDYEKAIVYFKKALKLNEELGNRKSVAVNLGNIGVGYGHLEQTEKSIDYYEQAARIHIEIGDDEGLLYNYNNLGIEYTKLKKFDVALDYFGKSLEILRKEPDDYKAVFTYNSIGSTYLQKGVYSKAFEFLEKGRLLAEKMNAMDQMMDNYKQLSEYFSLVNNPKKELEYFKKYIKYRDTILNEENMRNTIQMENDYKYKQKISRDSLLNAQKNRLKNAELKAKNAEIAANTNELSAQQNYLYITFGGLALVLIFAFLMYNRFKISQKQNAIINKQKQQVEIQKKDLEYQKSLVDVKQKEIIDSINYAQRIQQAILATPDEIKKYLPDSFLLYKPKDIVAGDFYFFEITDTHLFIASADCTGHGVPGALVSVVCANALTRCAKEFKLTDPGAVLNKTRELVLETFRKSGTDVKDGMDISLLVLEIASPDIETDGKRKLSSENRDHLQSPTLNFKSIYWAGANNPLWYANGDSIIEIAADKQSIGQSYDPKPFTTHSVNLQPDSWLFLFTDGYADQFGGPEGKKFKYSNLQKLFLEVKKEKPEFIKFRLEQVFNDWRGDLEQVDDVCIIGIKIGRG